MAGQSLLDMLLGRGQAISNLATTAANGAKSPQPAAPAPPVEQRQNFELTDIMAQLTAARQKQQARLAAEALQTQGGQVLPQRF